MLWWIVSAVVLASVLYALAGYVASRRAYARFSGRSADIQDWSSSFPDASEADCRKYLALFVEAFGLPRDDAMKFRPDDELLAIYRAIYPKHLFVADCMEIENLAIALDKEYGLDLLPMFHDSLRLGDIFHRIRKG
jgi:propanediol dehydratase small subunit